jgi:hypothetical protein
MKNLYFIKIIIYFIYLNNIEYQIKSLLFKILDLMIFLFYFIIYFL